MAAPRSLDAAMGAFGRLLRAYGFTVTAGESVEALRVLEVVDLEDREEVRLALRTVFPSRPEEVPLFDRAFDLFWRPPGRGMPAVNDFPLPPEPKARLEGEAPDGGPPRAPSLRDWADAAPADDGDAPLETAGRSDLEALVDKDFSTFAADELPEVLRLTRRIARRLAGAPGRRRRPARRGVVDVRRSVRRNVTRGELIDLAFRQRRPRKPRLVVLCDVSGSMDLYSRFLVQFLYALQHVFERMDTFTFSTRLTHVTDHLRARSFAGALRGLGAVRDWSGGTRIGESLERFTREWGERLVDRRTIVLVLSDGWDTGDPDVLARALLAIRRRAARVVWLNPLLGEPSYEPLARGMAAALPFVHHFLPAHNLASLRALERVLRI